MTNSDVEMYYAQAMSFLGQGEVHKSLEFFDKTLSMDNQHIPSWNNKGIALLNLNKYKEAIECFDHVIDLDANDTMPWYNKGYAFLLLDDYESSKEAFRVFLSRYPKKDDFYKFALYLQAKAYYGLKDNERAYNALLAVLKKDKNFKEAQELLNIISMEMK